MSFQIKNIAEKISNEKGFLLINVITKGSKNKPGFEIYIDNKAGVSAEDCADFSRRIKKELESTEIADMDYKLIVSSPGIDEPLKFLEQYHKHIGREFKLSYLDADEVKSIEAKLLQIDNDILRFGYKKEEIDVNYKQIKKAKVKISF